MASRSISVTMESSYRSSLSKGLRQDKQKIDAFQDYLNKRGFTIPVRINLKGFQEQAGAMRKIVLGAFADLPASILGADGRPASTASSGKAGNNRAGLLSRTTPIRHRCPHCRPAGSGRFGAPGCQTVPRLQ